MLWWFVSVVQKLLQFNDTMQKLFLLIEVQDLCFIAIFLVKTNNVTVSNYKLQFSLHNWPKRKQLFPDCGQQWCFSSDIGDQFSFISVQRQYFQFLFHFNLIYLKIDFYFNSVQLAYWNHFQHVFWGILNQKNIYVPRLFGHCQLSNAPGYFLGTAVTVSRTGKGIDTFFWKDSEADWL